MRLPVYSASQLETWQDCNRKWAWDKIAGMPRQANASALLGTAVHLQLEDHLNGKGLDFARHHRAAELAQLAIPHLPAPLTPGLRVEPPFDKVTLTPSLKGETEHLWTGRIDWMLSPAPGVVVIGDHKTTSDIGLYGKDEAMLRKDIQSQIYSRWAIELGYWEIHLQWTYIQTRGAKKAEPIRLQLDPDQVWSRFDEIDEIASEIDAARTTLPPDPLLYPYNPSACEKYGGCPYRHLCNLSPRESIRAMANQVPPGASSPVYQQLAGAAGLPQAQQPRQYKGMSAMVARNPQGQITHALNGKPLPPNVVQTQYVPNPAVHNSYLPLEPGGAELTLEAANFLEACANEYEKLQAAAPQAPQVQAPPAYQPPQAYAPPGHVVPPPAPTLLQAPPQAAPLPPPGAINPPAYTPPGAPIAPVPTAPPPSPPPVPSQAPAATEGKKGPGRPAGSKNKAKEGQAGQAGQAAAPAEPGVLVLYVGCRPVKGSDAENCQELDDILVPVRARMLQVDGLHDYALGDFGKGSAALALYVEEQVRGMLPAGDVVLHVDPGTREASIVLSRLVNLATQVVRG